jgi:hypothetical protein
MVDYTSNALALLQAWSGTFEQHYRPGVADFLKRFGKTTRIIPQRKQRVMGNSIEYEVKAYHNRGTRVSNDPMQNQPGHQPGAYTRFTVTFDHTTPASNHFASFECAFTTTIYDMWKRGDKTWKDSPDFIRKDVEEGLADVRETFAKYIHLNNEGLLAEIDTTARGNGIYLADDDRVDSASVFAGDAAVCMVKLKPTAIARIGDGQRVDIYNRTDDDYACGTNLRVAYVHPYDNTAVLEIVNRTGVAAGGDDTLDEHLEDAGAQATSFGAGGTPLNLLADCAAGDDLEIYLHRSGPRAGVLNFLGGGAPHGTLDRLFDADQAYYGVTRLAVTYPAGARMLIPLRIDASSGGADVPLTADLFRRIGETVGWTQGAHNATASLAMVMSNYEYRQISDCV